MSDLQNEKTIITMEEEAPTEEVVIKKAKYKIKNAEEKYELVYLETSADQVEETDDRKFVNADEKGKITSNATAIETIKGQITVINGEASQEGSIRKALQDAKAYADQKISEIPGIDGEVEGVLEAAKEHTNQAIGQAKTELTGKITENTQSITELKQVVSNHTKTIVVDNINEIATANAEPNVGDLAYVISKKKTYIYKGTDVPEGEQPAATLQGEEEAAPEGWVIFDEISSEVDLVGYLKTTDAESTYRKVATKIVEGDLEEGFKTKINGKLDQGQVDARVEEKVAPVRDKANQVETKLGEKLDRSALTGEVNNIVNPIKENLVQQINQKINTSDVDGKIDAKLNPAKTELNTKIDNLVVTVSSEQPEGKATGHIWLQTAAEATVEPEE